MLSVLSRFTVVVLFALPYGTLAQDSALDHLPRAKIIEVIQGDGALTREFFGRVAARETVDLAFQVGGQIVELPIVEGEPIPKGGLIAKLDTAPFKIALDQAQAQSDQANRTVTRLTQLSGNSVSQVMIDDAQTQADLMAIAVRDAERSLNNATLTAPFDALVATRNVANFSTVGAGTPIARLHDMSELHIEIDVPEVLFQRTGSDADVTIEAEFPGITERFALEVREFNAETSTVGQTFGITFAMPPPADHVILPGASVIVYATIRGAQPGMFIPGSAVVLASDGTAQVMVFTPDADDPDKGTVKTLDITITPSDMGEVLVTAGLSSGSEIIASGAERLRDGDRVQRFTGFAN